MPRRIRQTTLDLLMSNNELIKRSQLDELAPDAYFWSMCRTRNPAKKQRCLSCLEEFQTSSNRICSRCDKETTRRSNANYKAKLRGTAV